MSPNKFLTMYLQCQLFSKGPIGKFSESFFLSADFSTRSDFMTFLIFFIELLNLNLKGIAQSQKNSLNAYTIPFIQCLFSKVAKRKKVKLRKLRQYLHCILFSFVHISDISVGHLNAYTHRAIFIRIWTLHIQLTRLERQFLRLPPLCQNPAGVLGGQDLIVTILIPCD